MVKLYRQMLVAALAIGAGFAGQAQAYDHRVTVKNESETAIVSFYASNVDENVWRWDWLGTDTLPSGYQTTINIDDGSGHCHYDFKTVFSTGETVIRRDVNVCAISSYALTSN